MKSTPKYFYISPRRKYRQLNQHLERSLPYVTREKMHLFGPGSEVSFPNDGNTREALIGVYSIGMECENFL